MTDRRRLGITVNGVAYELEPTFEGHRQALPKSRTLRSLAEKSMGAGDSFGSICQIKEADWGKRPTPRSDGGLADGIHSMFKAKVAAAGEAAAAKPTPAAAPSSSDAALSTVLRDALGLDGIGESITREVLQRLSVDEDLLTAVADAAGVPRKVEHVFPEGKSFTTDGVEHPEFATLAKLIGSGKVNRIWISGDAGTGKTYAVEQLAKALDMPLFVVTPVSDKYELVGYRDSAGVYQETELYRWASHSGPAILLIDEIDGCHPNAALSLNAVLANGLGVFPNGQVPIADDKIVIATANTTGSGATMKYNARMQQDAALLDRWQAYVHWAIHEPTEEAIALAAHSGTPETVAASQRIRGNLSREGIDREWGPRRTYALCRNVAAGIDVRQAALYAGLSTLDEQQRERALKGVR